MPALLPELLILQRDPFRKNCTTGNFFWRYGTGRITPLNISSLELPWKNNEDDVSCIPAGRYRMAWTMSPRLKRNTWRLLDVPDRAGILIHVANFVSELRGCIAPGLFFGDINNDGVIDITQSGPGLKKLQDRLQFYQHDGIDIEIRNAA